MFKGGIILGGLGSGGLLSTAFLFLAGNAKNEKTRENFFDSVLDGRKIEIESLFKNRGGLFYAIPQGEKGIDGELKVVTNKEGKEGVDGIFDSGCEFVRSVLGENGRIKYLKEKGRKILNEKVKESDWKENIVREILEGGENRKGCSLDKILNSSSNEFRPYYLVDVSKFSEIRGQSGLINFGRNSNEQVKLSSWGIYQTEKQFDNGISKIRIIEGKGKGRELTYDLYISTEWTKQLEDWSVENKEDVVLGLSEFGPREGNEITEQKGLTNLIWKAKGGKWMFARFDLGLAPAVRNLKEKIGYLESGEEKCKTKSESFNSIKDNKLCEINSDQVKSQKWQTWFPKILSNLEKSENNSSYPFKRSECENLKECIEKAIGNSKNSGTMVGVWGEVGILDDSGGVRWRSF
ncbi:hypothetical protein [Mycoplasma parvum]|uniref:Uncharacterized protein n=1 Tax=Mycoplasma parvum str. Indiana TaxID=1403316 RepID=U5NFZ7_9MOLU|nr:hypothetical protein [Mycoplasma parvum]AGX89178.1 hypothetical protein PRV_02200 [Mycoplasma parvum str. Indiana]